MDINSIIDQFQIKGSAYTVAPFGNGHINDTFHVHQPKAVSPDYLLQKINHQVFPKVALMMKNIRMVTDHLKLKNPEDPMGTLTIIPTQEGGDFYLDSEGQYWRMYILLQELVSYDVAERPEQIYEGARAFGTFLYQLEDFPAADLYPIIPDFHNVISRLRAFQFSFDHAETSRKAVALASSKYLLSLADSMCEIQRLGDLGKIPLRVTHNDTKFNNVLLDHSGRGRCVIDLDTVMPGFVHYDFGDGIRTSITKTAEDEPDLKKIQIDLHRFEAFAEGYLSGTSTLLNPIEIQYLSRSGALMAYIMGVRFLTDFLSGDVYYKIHFPEHNLQRARAQLELVRKILERLPELDAIVRKFSLKK